MKTEKDNQERTVMVNTDPQAGPLDGASAFVNVARTIFEKDDEGKDRFRQQQFVGKIQASYELGVMSISLPDENIMLSVRIDEAMQVMFASAGAYKKLQDEEGEDRPPKDSDVE